MTFQTKTFLYSMVFIGVLCVPALADYEIGVGIADCTGPSAGIVFMGYAKGNQKGSGLHLRQFSRAFILKDGEHRLVFVSIDVGMIGQGIRRTVLDKLQKRYGDIYNSQNVILSGTHTHGGPGGYLMDVLFDITCMGFSKQSFDAIVDGIEKSIINAHSNMVQGKVYLSTGEVMDANINRSPSAYLQNPVEERKEYTHDVDKELVQLKFVASADGTPLGVINWFPVHPTSMNNTNHLVTSDNVGLAAILLEKKMNNGALPGKGKFVAAFASSNLGDVSPNTRGARCVNTGDACETDSSTCSGDAKYCIASGPGKDMYESTKIIADKIGSKAEELLNSNGAREVTGPLKTIHQFVDMPDQKIEYTFPNKTVKQVTGCKPAMGYSFAAGTTDGPGEFDFKQGTITENPFWRFVRDFLAKPEQEDIDCQYPKPILLATGRMQKPYQWQPSIVDTQIAMIGDVVIAAIPGEFTTMSGRRMKKAIKEVITANGGSADTKVIIAGLCNTYSDYITTTEEYQVQRYEAASTIYGPYTLPIYINQYKLLTEALLMDNAVGAGPSPPDFSDSLISFIAPVIMDLPEYSTSFGDCVLQPPKENVHIGDTVSVKFVSGHPRNNLMHGESYLTVEKKGDGNKWSIVATDANWETKFKWDRTYFASSEVTIEWEVPADVTPGTYIIRHYGYAKALFGAKSQYSGSTNEFTVSV